jgi:hypothetical protein
MPKIEAAGARSLQAAVGGKLPLFTELPRRRVFPETELPALPFLTKQRN